MDESLSKRSTIIAWINRRLVAVCVLLAFAGRQPPEGGGFVLNRLAAAYCFLHFLILPRAGLFEEPSAPPIGLRQSILTPASPGVHGGIR